MFMANIVIGSVKIPIEAIVTILSGGDGIRESWKFIVLQSRLPQAVTALLSGASLATCGLMLQTTFRNPLAGPDVFGINSGAGLGVALVMLAFGGNMSVGMFSVSGFIAILLAAFAGAMLVTVLVFGFSSMVRNNVMLLIIGLMIGYLANSAISLLNFFATEDGVKSYMVWGMGNFGGVTMDNIPLFSVITLVGLIASLMMIKPLNAMLLGEQYAENLGINVRQTRNILLVITGLLTAIVTAFCGPVAFIGLAVPHIARLLLKTDNHRMLLPATMLCGALIALICNVLCYLPSNGGMIPLNAVTPVMGAPVIIYVILKKR
jgi:iron complex transport system permease protein